MRKKRNFFIWTLFLLITFLVLSIFTPLSSTVKNITHSSTFHLQRIFFNVGSSFFQNLEVFQNAKEIKDEIRMLRTENRKLVVDLSILDILKEENKALREILEIEYYDEKEFVFAEVYGRDLFKQQIVVRHGKKVEEGDLVVTPEGVLVGMIEETENDFSTVELITSKGSSLEVKVQNKEEPIGVLEGVGEKNLLLSFLPKDKGVARGDAVVSLAYNKTAGGIFVGRILEVKDTDVEAFNQATVWQGIDYRYLDYLLIIRR